MKELLKAYFGSFYNSPKVVDVKSRVVSNAISLSDDKACSDCRKVTSHLAAECDRTVLRCEASENVEVIDWEGFLNAYSGLKAIRSFLKCDLMLVGEQKIVLCDMSCSNAKYIYPYQNNSGEMKIGKREYAKKQLLNTIELLIAVPEIASEINLKLQKTALFAYREKVDTNNDAFDSRIARNMAAFNRIGNAINAERMYSDIGNGFYFTEVKYPEVYVW